MWFAKDTYLSKTSSSNHEAQVKIVYGYRSCKRLFGAESAKIITALSSF